MRQMTRSYSELSRLRTLEERFEYLSLSGTVGEATFGFERYLNQEFYRSYAWKQARDVVIMRDEGCDLGIRENPIHDRVIIHHIQPLTQRMVLEGSSLLLDPENLITTSHRTHNAIHYGDSSLLPQPFVDRRQGDTQSWERRW